jgi:hypothetical protein
VPGDIQVAAYYFPNYHQEPRNAARYGKGWNEWALVRAAMPRYPGHLQPKTPVWGYEDESDPAVFARKIDAAADHGIDTFLFDWYWHDEGMFLQRALEEGYLCSPNRDRIQFALMWANHDWVDIFPATAGKTPALHYPGAVTADAFAQLTDYVIQRYFCQPQYWRLDGCPYFSIYELYRLIEGFGSVEATRQALMDFRQRTIAAGFPDLHLNAVIWGVQILPGEQTIKDPNSLLAALGFQSVTSYVWVHHVPLAPFPRASYTAAQAEMETFWAQAQHEFALPYYPNVTMGWDASPRTNQDGPFVDAGYPYTPVLEGNSPAAFEGSLRAARAFLAQREAKDRILTINAWNEWTEGSYLEPDTVHGMQYLEAVRNVFGPVLGQKAEQHAP